MKDIHALACGTLLDDKYDVIYFRLPVVTALLVVTALPVVTTFSVVIALS